MVIPRTTIRATAGLCRSLFPDDVAVAELAGEATDYVLMRRELETLGPVGPARRREFERGRGCAHAALGRLEPSLATHPVAIGADRQPVWPVGVRGSITHCQGYAVAAVARRTDYLAVGVDVEPDQPLPDRVRRRIVTAGEWSGLSDLERALPTGPAWDRLIFCAKEAIFKAWYPVEGTWLDFTDAVVTIDPVQACFEAQIVGPRAAVAREVPDRLTGRIGFDAGFIVAAVVVGRK